MASKRGGGENCEYEKWKGNGDSSAALKKQISTFYRGRRTDR